MHAHATLAATLALSAALPVLAAPDDDGVAAAVREKVEALCRKFPLYPEPRT